MLLAAIRVALSAGLVAAALLKAIALASGELRGGAALLYGVVMIAELAFAAGLARSSTCDATVWILMWSVLGAAGAGVLYEVMFHAKPSCACLGQVSDTYPHIRALQGVALAACAAYMAFRRRQLT